MVKVKNIMYTESPFDSKDKNFLRCLGYAKSINPDTASYIPNHPKQTISFELTDANEGLANCIRRYLIDEIPSFSMIVNEDVITDDRFILMDFIKKNIELIPFKQDLTDPESIVISLNVENKTDEPIDIFAKDFVITQQKKVLDISDYITTTSSFITLKPGKKLEINNITIIKGIGKHDSGKFSPFSNVSYKILDIEPVSETKFSKTGKSSLNSSPKHFQISFTTHRNRDAKKIMPLCCDLITSTITKIAKDLKNIKEDMKIYFSDLITLETKGEVKFFHFKGEYWTISNLISRYCYICDNNIPFVCSSVNHPLTEESTVEIRHGESIEVLNAALKLILSDIDVIKKAF